MSDSSGSNRFRVLLIGPSPPPYGGIANFMVNFRKYLEKRGISYCFHRTGRTTKEYDTLPHALLREGGRMLRFIRTKSFRECDIVHIHTASYSSFYRNMFYIFFSSKILRKRTIVHIHGGGFEDFMKNSKFRILIRNSLESADVLVVTSEIWRKKFSELCPGCKRIEVIYAGMSPEIFRPMDRREIRNELGLPPNRIILLTVGVYERHKGYQYMVRALKKIVAERDDVTWALIARDGDYKDDIMTSIEKEGLRKHFMDVGEKSADEVSMWMNASDIFVLPSMVEGNPTVMYEALATGLPFVGTDVGGISDVIRAEEYGIIVEPKDPDALSAAILHAVKKDWNREKIALYGSRFSWESVGKHMERIYRELLENKNQ